MSANYYAMFPSNIIFNYGYTSLGYPKGGGGCGYAKNFKIYQSFSFSDISEIDPY